MTIYWQLFFAFFKIGCFSFGGGMAMLPLIEQEIVMHHGWMTSSGFVDMVAIAEMTPGPIGINSATYVGYTVGGIGGALLASFAVVLPSFIIVSLIYILLSRLSGKKELEWTLRGLRPIVVGLVLAALFSLGRTGLTDWKAILIAVVVFFLAYRKQMHPILSMVIAGIMGLILY